jgi:hypothetical protein
VTAKNSAQRYFIPAAPGFWLLELCGGLAAGEYEATREPIIAWEAMPIDEDKPESACFAVPVTTEWDYADLQHAPVLGPDGRVRIAGETTYPSEAEWLKDASAKAGAR